MGQFNNEIWFVGAEMAPLVKAGGLGDVMGSLPKALLKAGMNVRVVIPYYKNIIPKDLMEVEKSYPAGTVNFGEIPFEFGVKTGFASGGIPLVLIEQGHFFNREEVYGAHGGAEGYKDNLWRFAMLAHGTAYAMKILGIPLVVHAHDWSGGFVPAVVRQTLGDKRVHVEGAGVLSTKLSKHINAKGLRPALVFTIHNLRYQGVYGIDDFYDIGLDFKYNSSFAYEHFGTINSLKGGIKLSDVLTTVSPTYASEITTHSFGFGLDGELKNLKDEGRLKGILNGIDLDYWNPKTDNFIYYNLNLKKNRYNLESYKEWKNFKLKNKRALFSEISMPVKTDKNGVPFPLIGIVSRLAEEKGINELLDALFNWNDFPFQVVILGSGEDYIERKAGRLSEVCKDKVYARIGKYDEALSHKIYAASDIFVMPSKFEPCGLSQMIAMRYGCVIAAGDTGGLHDTVSDISDDNIEEPTGILIKYVDAAGISWALDKLYGFYISDDIGKWCSLIVNSANRCFGWDDSAKVYEDVYYSLL
ncbi:glycogen synthase [Candidatus Acidulodesulfobacterium sp. H_13]|uniref:glycogen synthase n=1 Tax=Candidatus Acidulodesulfobacterium sp. H_13 TaxID=3395470 RepID=UPI003AF7EB13